jgi:hypothetical protein
VAGRYLQKGVPWKNHRDPPRTGEALKGPWLVEEEEAPAALPFTGRPTHKRADRDSLRDHRSIRWSKPSPGSPSSTSTQVLNPVWPDKGSCKVWRQPFPCVAVPTGPKAGHGHHTTACLAGLCHDVGVSSDPSLTPAERPGKTARARHVRKSRSGAGRGTEKSTEVTNDKVDKQKRNSGPSPKF